MGMGDSGSKWCLSCLERSRLLNDVLFLRDVSLGQMQDPFVFMGTYGLGGYGIPQRKVQLLAGGFTLKVSSPNGEVLAELPYHAIQRIRRLGDVVGGFVIKYQQEWHVFVSDDRDELIKTMVEMAARLGVQYDFGCSIALIEVENEIKANEKLRLHAVQVCMCVCMCAATFASRYRRSACT